MTTNNVATWLEKLQQESWNLELLISGFSILLLVQAKDQLLQLLEYIELHYAFTEEIDGVIDTFVGSGILSCVALIICLSIHILLRGFWIGAIGLRSVQPTVDLKRLRYAPTFEQRLTQQLPSLDRLLVRLDQISSAIFSFAFLIIFMLLSLVAWFFTCSVIVLLRDNLYALFEEETWRSETVFYGLTIPLLLVILFGLLYLIDTLSIGVLKKICWFKSRPYIWIYRFMVAITLSFLYRSIYYHLVSYLGVWVSRILLSAFILGMILIPFLRLDHEIFFSDLRPSNQIQSHYYDDMRAEGVPISNAAIPTATVTKNQLPLFIRYSPEHNKTIQHLCTDYQPSRTMGLRSGVRIDQNGFGLSAPTVEEASTDSLLMCLRAIYHVYLDDSLHQDLQFYYLEHPNKSELGLYTVLNIRHLQSGHHLLKITRDYWSPYRDTLYVRNYATIPFWRE